MSTLDARNKSKRKYDEKTYDRINIVFKKGEKQEIADFVKPLGYSLNGFIVEAVHEKINSIKK